MHLGLKREKLGCIFWGLGSQSFQIFFSDNLSHMRSRLKSDDYNSVPCNRPEFHVRGPESCESRAEPWPFSFSSVSRFSLRNPSRVGARLRAALLLLGCLVLCPPPPCNRLSSLHLSGCLCSHPAPQPPGVQRAPAHPHPLPVHGCPRALCHPVPGLLQEHPRHHPRQERAGAGGTCGELAGSLLYIRVT